MRIVFISIVHTASLQIDMVQIKQCFLELTKQTLWRWLKDDCSGDYRKLLQGLVGKDQNNQYTEIRARRRHWKEMYLCRLVIKYMKQKSNNFLIALNESSSIILLFYILNNILVISFHVTIVRLKLLSNFHVIFYILFSINVTCIVHFSHVHRSVISICFGLLFSIVSYQICVLTSNLPYKQQLTVVRSDVTVWLLPGMEEVNYTKSTIISSILYLTKDVLVS